MARASLFREQWTERFFFMMGLSGVCVNMKTKPISGVGPIVPIAKRIFHVCTIVGLSALFACEETLPPRDLKDFLSPVFRTVETGDVFFRSVPDTIIFGSGSFFSIGLKNNSDEYLQARSTVRGTLEISSTSPPFHRTFEFTLPEYDIVTIRPLSEFTVNVRWDQRDDSCRYAFRDLNLDRIIISRTEWWRTTRPVTFRAKGRIQIWPNVQTKELPEITFSRIYYFDFDPRPDFMSSRSCRQFR